MKFYFVLWSVVLSLPVPVRFLLEIGIGTFLLWLIWPVVRFIAWLCVQILTAFNTFLFGSIRHILGFFGRGSEKAYDWDEKLGQNGRKIRDSLEKRGKAIKTNKKRVFLHKKATWFFLLLLYLLSVLPCFGLEKKINIYYLEEFYRVHHFFMAMEENLTRGKEKYPDLFIKEPYVPAMAEAEEEKAAEEAQDIILELGEDTSYANVREQAGAQGARLCMVSKEDVLVYQNEMQDVKGRIWLKIKVASQDDVVGWISTKVLRDDVLQELDAENK